MCSVELLAFICNTFAVWSDLTLCANVNSMNDRYSKNVSAGHEIPSHDVAVTVGCAMRHTNSVCV